MSRKVLENWELTNLGEIIVTKNNKSKQLKSTEYRKTGIFPVVDQSINLICGYSDEKRKAISSDLPIIIFGDHTRHTKFISFPFIAGADGTQLLKPAKGIDDKFFYYLVSFASKKIGNYGYDRHFKHLKDFQCLYPTDECEQQKIAAILTAIDRAIAHTEALIEKYQQIKAGLMHDLFTRGIGADGKLRPTREEAPELYQESAIGWIPKEWEVKQLVELVHFQRGHDIVESSFVEGDFPVISSGGIIGFHNEFTSRGPSVVVGRKGTIGKVHFVESDFWAHDTSLFATDLFGNEPLFIFYLCNHLDLAKYGTKSGSPSLNRNDIHPLAIGKPPLTEQKAIASRLNTCDNKISALSVEKMKLSNLKSGLMQDLLTGKVPVKVDPDELDHI